MKTIEVSAAVIIKEGKLFATQRGYGEYKGWWEFPGGKLEEGETREQALIRELKEEMEVDIKVNDFIKTVEYDYPAFHLIMHCFMCEIISGTPKLLVHDSAIFVDKDEIDTLKWLPADKEILDVVKSKI